MKVKVGMMVGALAATCLVMTGCKAVKPNAPQPRKGPMAPQHQRPASVRMVDVPPARPADVKPLPPPVVVKPLPHPAEVKPLPPPPPPPPAVAATVTEKPAEPEYTIYTVKNGDTLSGICKHYGVRQRKVLDLNPGMKPNKIFVGKRIKLPGKIELKGDDAVNAAAARGRKEAAPKAKLPALEGAKAPANAAAASATAANVKAPVKTKAAYKPYDGPTKEYVVKSGDQLGKIAVASGISVRALKELNGLKNNNLRVGQKLRVPAEKQVPAKAEEAAKAAPAADAAKNSATKEPAAAPAAAEAAKPEVKADSAAPAPAAEAAPAAAQPEAAPAAESSAASNVETYTVKEGEDIVSIAINFNVTPSEVLELNDLKHTDQLKPGQVIKIPVKRQ